MKANITRIVIMFLVAFYFSCSSNRTAITANWKSSERPSSGYKNILLVGLTNNVQARETVEGEFEVKLYRLGITSQKSIKLFPPSLSNTNSVDKERILEAVKTNNNDAILTMSLIDKETESRYVPGAYGYDPAFRYSWYGDFGGYYSYWSPYVYDPGYYVKDKIYFIETNIYDAKTQKLVWSAQSKTYNPVDIESFAAEYTGNIVKGLLKDGIIKQQ